MRDDSGAFIADVICVTIEKPAVKSLSIKLLRFVRGLGSEHPEIFKLLLIARVHAATFSHPDLQHARI
jgi:hypothetical protein